MSPTRTAALVGSNWIKTGPLNVEKDAASPRLIMQVLPLGSVFRLKNQINYWSIRRSHAISTKVVNCVFISVPRRVSKRAFLASPPSLHHWLSILYRFGFGFHEIKTARQLEPLTTSVCRWDGKHLRFIRRRITGSVPKNRILSNVRCAPPRTGESRPMNFIAALANRSGRVSNQIVKTSTKGIHSFGFDWLHFRR